MSTGPPRPSYPTPVPLGAYAAHSPVRIAMRPLIASVIVLVGGICAGLSAFSPWWTIATTGEFDASFNFLPGTDYTLSSGRGGVPSPFPYAGHPDLASLAGLYEGILALTIVILVLSMIVGILGVLASFGRLPYPTRLRPRYLVVALLLIALVAAALVPVAQPMLIHGCGAGPSECSSFWGTASGSGETTVWGANVGWYLTVATVVLLGAALFIWGPSASQAWGTAPAVPAIAPATFHCPRCGQPRAWGPTPCPTCGSP
ncbi:MAG: hypothetical protein WA688_06980 [Thermoplasmata archaeon]